jgi:cytochrome P450
MIARMADTAITFDPQMMFDFPDPYPMFAGIRAAEMAPTYAFMNRTSTIIARYDDVLAVLKDADTFSSRANAEVGKFFGRSIIEMDGKEHARTRGIVNPVFAARGIDAMQKQLAAFTDELLDTIAPAGRADLVAQFTTIFPVQVIATIIGVPRKDYAQFMKWSLDLIAFSKDPEKGHAASRILREYLLPVVRARRAERRDDVTTKLVEGRVDDHELSDEEIINFLRLLLPAGAETTSRLMGSMLFALLAERDTRWERVRADRTLVRWAIEETLRWETPVLFIARQAMRDVEVHNAPIPAGRTVSVVVASANRDERHYTDPDTFDLDRHADDHISFAFGKHFCLGYHLAKLEAETALTALLDRFPNLRFDPDAPPPRITGLAFRSPPSLPVRF